VRRSSLRSLGVITVTVIVVASLLGMAWTIVSAGQPQKKYFFTFANVTEAGPLFVLLHQGVQWAANTGGFRVKFYNNNFDGTTAVRNARLMIQDKPDLAFEYNAIEGVGGSLGKMFRDAKIPCIAVNVPTPGCHWFNLVNRKVGIDTGNIVGEIAKGKGWTGDNTVVILVQNATAGTEVNDCVRWFYITLQDLLPNMSKTTPDKIAPTTTKIGTTGVYVDGKSALEPSFVGVRNILQTIPKDKNLIVYTVNDDSTLGAWRAVQEAGRTSNALVAGLGGSKEGLGQLRQNPNWVAEGDVFFYYWGEYLMAMAMAVLQGAQPPKVTTSPQGVLTKETVDKYYRPGETKAFRLPPLEAVKDGFGNDYLAKYGVLQKFKNVEGLQ
jgi:ribose transport system substrate-binding protein